MDAGNVCHRFDLVFVGGVFTPEVYRDYISVSRGVIQNAADVLQKGVLRGIRESCDVRIVNLPFIGSYPRLSPFPYIPPGVGEVEGCRVLGGGFSNRRGIRLVSRTFSTFLGLWRECSRDQVILVYSAHFPFLVAAVAFKFLRPKSKICLILPDLPEHMGLSGWAYRLLKWLANPISRFLIRRFDRVIGLTKYVQEYLCLPSGKYLVIEGVASDSARQPAERELWGGESGRPVRILYSGTLARRYGILRLLGAFRALEGLSVELIICGAGDALQEVEEAAKSDSRVKYLGQLTRDEVLTLQCSVDVLVNPRVTEFAGDFTYFSFPSKILEYMSSGTPVVMARLAGVPADYDGFYFCPRDNSVDALASELRSVCALSYVERREFGMRAREFVLEKKSALRQGRKIVRHIFGGAESERADWRG